MSIKKVAVAVLGTASLMGIMSFTNIQQPSTAHASVNTAASFKLDNNNSSNTMRKNSMGSSSESAARNWISDRESGGSYTVSNGNCYGRFQLDKSLLGGDYSPAHQKEVANNYVYSRYGSWQDAKAHWLQYNWY